MLSTMTDTSACEDMNLSDIAAEADAAEKESLSPEEHERIANEPNE